MIGILILLGTILGVSFALWKTTAVQISVNKMKTSCFSISMTNEKNEIKLTNAFPMLDKDGMELVPFSFTITNTCNLFTSYTVNLEMPKTSSIPSKYIRVMVNKEEVQTLGSLAETELNLKNTKEARIVARGSLGEGDSEDYTVRLWIDGDVTQDNLEVVNQIFQTKVVVSAIPSDYSPVKYGITRLGDALIANENQTSVEKSKEKILAKQAVDFSKTAPIIDWQEKHESSTSTYEVTMPHPNLVNSGIAGTEELTETKIYPYIGTGYTFDKEKGMYNLTNAVQVDPTTLNYSNDYYTCSAGAYITDIGVLIAYSSINNQSACYKINSVTKSETTIGTYEAVRYSFNVNKYTQIELESDKSDKGLYTMEDDWGLSYYYRGNVNNNYVKFGGFYWRAIRINGDGSIRLLFAGDKPNATGNDLKASLTDVTLGFNNTKSVSFNTAKGNNGYVGYMYGNTLGVSYEQEHANENDSNIKKYLDSWYRQNIEEKGFSNYIADAGFCNDRSLASNSQGNGVEIDKQTIYGGYERYQKSTPSLFCPNETNDLFTLSGNSKGNGALIYPIGLITVDELMLSGYSGNNLNRMAYTYTSSEYWFMSPAYFWDTAREFLMQPSGYGAVYNVSDKPGVRPVINLSPDVEITEGIGTANNPFIVK